MSATPTHSYTPPVTNRAMVVLVGCGDATVQATLVDRTLTCCPRAQLVRAQDMSDADKKLNTETKVVMLEHRERRGYRTVTKIVQEVCAVHGGRCLVVTDSPESQELRNLQTAYPKAFCMIPADEITQSRPAIDSFLTA